MDAKKGAYTLLILIAAATAAARQGAPGGAPTAAELTGAWAGMLSHEGSSVPFTLELEPGADGRVLLKATIPVVYLAHQPLGAVNFKAQGDNVELGPFTFRYNRSQKTLEGVMPATLVPVYRVPVTLRKVDRVVVPERPEPVAPAAQPAWAYDAGAPLWAGPAFAGGVVYAGSEDGSVHAVNAEDGARRWVFKTGGPVRTRPVVSEGFVYLQSDDGYLYKIAAAGGEQRWRVRATDKPIERLPFDNPKSRYDRFGSDVTVTGGRLYLGTHDGKVLAVDAASGSRIWEFACGDSVLSAPSVDSGRVYFGSLDRGVYALDATTGRLVWKQDTKGGVVSTPVFVDDLLIVGNRCYDLLALEANTGEVAWKRYIWFSWIESTATVRDGFAYIGSSDAARLYSIDVHTGHQLWEADVRGWAWGQPAVTEGRVYATTSSRTGYIASHEGGVTALDRRNGRAVWRFTVAPPASGTYGFPGSPAAGAGLVYAGGLDGKLYAFPQ